MLQLLAISLIFTNLSAEQKGISKKSFDQATAYINRTTEVSFNDSSGIKIYVYVNPLERDIAYFGYPALACLYFDPQGRLIGGDIVFQSNDALADVNIVQHELSHFLGLKNNSGKKGIMSSYAVWRARGKPMQYSRQELVELKQRDHNGSCNFCLP